MKISPLKDWLSDEKPIIISGPCSAESFEQLMQTAICLKDIENVKVFRAGVWKPRTRPSKFEGVGDIGLEWLKEVRKETGLKTAVEVASQLHVEKALKANVDMLWIGARTVVNPFLVQNIADTLKGVDIPVMVKNPLHPDVDLWIGALERLNKSGIDKLIAIHRGFFFYKNHDYRNQPMWEIPIELKRLVPELPVFCDPSHISGKRDNIFRISQKAIDLEMDGLMIETHIKPDEALTDANQQITPKELKNIINKISIRTKRKENESINSTIDKFRLEIDKLDAELLDILQKRMNIVDEIGKYKKNNDITILQIERWREMYLQRMDIGKNMGYNVDFLKKLLKLIHQESIRRQENIFEE